MSWRACAYVKLITSGITRSEKLLMMVLADSYNDHQEMAWPKLDLLSEWAMMSKRSSIRLLQSLERKGLLSVVRGVGRGNTSCYAFPQLNGDIVSPFTDAIKGDKSTVKGDIGSAEKVTSCFPKEEQEEEQNTTSTTRIEESVPPQPVEGPENHRSPVVPQYSWKTFRQLYPRHRIEFNGHEKRAHKIWNERCRDPIVAAKVCEALQVLVTSEEWTREDGRWVPSPEKFLEEERWHQAELLPETRQGRRINDIQEYFVKSSGQARSFSELRPERRRMLAKALETVERWTAGKSDPVDMAKAMIDKCLTERGRKHKDTQLETIFRDDATVERWARKVEFDEIRA